MDGETYSLALCEVLARTADDPRARARALRRLRAMMGGRAYARRGRALHYAARHAPVGGASIGGKHYPGGQFIPGDVMARATPEERAKVEGREETEHEKRWNRHADAKHAALRSALAKAEALPMAVEERKVLDGVKAAVAGEGDNSLSLAGYFVTVHLQHHAKFMTPEVKAALGTVADTAEAAGNFSYHAGKELLQQQYEEDVAAWEKANEAKEAEYEAAHEAWEARAEAYQERRDAVDEATGYDPDEWREAESLIADVANEWDAGNFDAAKAREQMGAALAVLPGLFDETRRILEGAGATVEDMAPLVDALEQERATVEGKFDEWLAAGEKAAQAYQVLASHNDAEPDEEPDWDALGVLDADYGNPKFDAMVEEIAEKYGTGDDDFSLHPKAQAEYERRNKELEEEVDATREALLEKYTAEVYDPWVERQTELEEAEQKAREVWGEAEAELLEAANDFVATGDGTMEDVKSALTARIDAEEAEDEEPEEPEYDEEPEAPDDEDMDEPEEEEEDISGLLDDMDWSDVT